MRIQLILLFRRCHTGDLGAAQDTRRLRDRARRGGKEGESSEDRTEHLDSTISRPGEIQNERESDEKL